MKKQSIILVLLLSFLIFIITACEDYTTSIDPLIDQVDDGLLTDESQINFVINGVHAEFTDTYEQIGLLSGLLADELIFDTRVPNATFPTFRDLDDGAILLDNNSVDNLFVALGQLRFFADNLVERAGEINFTVPANETKALYWGNFYGGVARYFYAAYFGLNEEEGGGVIDAGSFIPSADMYVLAVAKFTAALTHADPAQIKIVNTLLARIYIYQNDYTNAALYANSGMVTGDAPFQALYQIEDPNWWHTQAGQGRCQAALDFKYKVYIDSNSAETVRVKMDSLAGSDGTMFYMQNKYPSQSSPINLTTWQENELILAECALNGVTSAGTALDRVNDVRTSYGLADLTVVDMDVLMEERDKELMCTGNRLPDQRRWDIWHLAAGTWQYLPITEHERNANPNID